MSLNISVMSNQVMWLRHCTICRKVFSIFWHNFGDLKFSHSKFISNTSFQMSVQLVILHIFKIWELYMKNNVFLLFCINWFYLICFYMYKLYKCLFDLVSSWYWAWVSFVKYTCQGLWSKKLFWLLVLTHRLTLCH